VSLGCLTHSRLAVILVLLLAVTALPAWPSPAVAAPLTQTFRAVADTYAAENYPTVNFGDATRIKSDRYVRRVSYIKFNVSPLGGTIVSARLRLRVDNGSTGGGGVIAATHSDWSEATLTYQRRPLANGPALATIGPVKRGDWVEVDVTAAVSGSGRVSFGIRPNSFDGVEYSSREGRSAPTLIVTVEQPTPEPDSMLPGRIEAEEYRAGGPGIGFFDTTAGNAGGKLRDDDVDIENCVDLESPIDCYNIGWVRSGEWLAYNVGVTVESGFRFSIRYATPNTGRWIRIEVDGSTVIERIDLPSTGSFTTWATATAPPVTILAGDHVLRVIAGTGGMNLNVYDVETVDASEDVVLVGAGDIARCGRDDDEATAALLDTIPGTVFTLGDNAYPDGSAADFANCYEPSWGRHTARTRPAAGNHEYQTENAAAYFDYFGAAAGTPGEGWYSYTAGSWHVIVLNSNCSKNGGCGPDDPQATWLRTDLAAHPNTCTLAYWHHPRWSSGEYGDDTNMQTYWEMLANADAELVLNGHAHIYERFAPMDATGTPDPDGTREIVVGTGGGGLSGISAVHPQSEVRDNETFGVLKLTLAVGSYDWEFIPVAGRTFTDAGSGSCQ
jgi:hypothetical protein